MIQLDYFIALLVAVIVGALIGHLATSFSYQDYIGFLIRRIGELDSRKDDGHELNGPHDEADWWKHGDKP